MLRCGLNQAKRLKYMDTLTQTPTQGLWQLLRRKRTLISLVIQTCVRLWRKQEELFSKGTPTSEAVYLSLLGLDPEKYYPIKTEDNKREFIRKVIAQSSPSFGRFMTEVYEFQNNGIKNKPHSGESSKRLLGKLREIVSKDRLSKENLLEICQCAYEYSRAAKL